MMPNLIHAIWLGDKMPPLSHACLDDWKKMGFDYCLWNDSNDRVQNWIDSCSFAKECYERGLYAFVSDYLRLKILQEEGGLYLDTDVTIRKDPFPLFSGTKFVIGYETVGYLGTAAIYAEPDSRILAELIRFYEDEIWRSPLYIGPQIATHLIKDRKLLDVESCKLLPAEYFFPYQQEPIHFECPDESYLVHWFQHSWKDSPGMVFVKAKHLGVWGKLYVWQKYFFRGFSRG
ncbi:glycosyltransferase family 32 protein [Marinobacter sp. SS8-8]|uniref:glycosyltransferase family 32 protein n=1 Tax=Marinobacter sp. SS8-8 TaxID=3050452 RepID=UPI0026DFF593|nr:TcdA/TcdB catalytic glycosyltransferase domain-containing protein [Marinobacter sp. SS8-8]